MCMLGQADVGSAGKIGLRSAIYSPWQDIDGPAEYILVSITIHLTVLTHPSCILYDVPPLLFISAPTSSSCPIDVAAACNQCTT